MWCLYETNDEFYIVRIEDSYITTEGRNIVLKYKKEQRIINDEITAVEICMKNKCIGSTFDLRGKFYEISDVEVRYFIQSEATEAEIFRRGYLQTMLEII